MGSLRSNYSTSIGQTVMQMPHWMHEVSRFPKLSAFFAQAVQNEVDRLGLIALLDELEREDPISPESRAAGERLWQRISSSWIPERYRSSQSETEPSGERSARRQQTA